MSVAEILAQDREEKAAEQLVTDYASHEKAKRRGQEAADKELTAQRKINVVEAASFRPQRTEWLWRPNDADKGMPLAELVVLVGKGGSAKSQLLSYFTAGITTGTLPGVGYGQPGTVFYLYREDSAEKTVIPRLMAAGADLSRVKFIKVSFFDDDAELSLPRDCDALADAVRKYSVAAVMYDPLSSFLDVKDTSAQKTMRAAYERIRRMHEETGSTGIGLGHTRKAIAGSLLDAFMGSSEQGNVVRCAWGTIEDPEEPGIFILSQEKNNLAPKASSWTYRIEGAYVDGDDGIPIETQKVIFTGTSDTSVSEIMRDQMEGGRGEKVRAAMDFLREYLTERGGEAMRKEIFNAAHGEHAASTLEKAARRLHIESIQHGKIGHSGWGTLWRLRSGA